MWRPPLLGGTNFIGAIRRFFDLQAGSIWNDMKTLLPEQKGRILDVGCGSQPFRPLLSKDAAYTGLDTNDAKYHFGYEVPDTVYYDGTTLPFEDSTFDAILCTETMEHVLDCQFFVSELSRALRSSGTLILTVPFAARWHFIPHDYWRYTPSSLNHLLTNASFDNIEVYARGNHVTVACYKTMALVLPFLFSPIDNIFAKILLRLTGLIFAPLVVVLAVIGNLGLLSPGGDDCLGYTVVARKTSRK